MKQNLKRKSSAISHLVAFKKELPTYKLLFNQSQVKNNFYEGSSLFSFFYPDKFQII